MFPRKSAFPQETRSSLVAPEFIKHCAKVRLKEKKKKKGEKIKIELEGWLGKEKEKERGGWLVGLLVEEHGEKEKTKRERRILHPAKRNEFIREDGGENKGSCYYGFSFINI